jgi:hypothetical protein
MEAYYKIRETERQQIKNRKRKNNNKRMKRTIHLKTDEYRRWRQHKVKLSLCLTMYHAMKTYGRVVTYLHAFLTSALDRREWSASRPSCFTPGERDTIPVLQDVGWAPEPAGRGGE